MRAAAPVTSASASATARPRTVVEALTARRGFESRNPAVVGGSGAFSAFRRSSCQFSKTLRKAATERSASSPRWSAIDRTKPREKTSAGR